MLKTEVHYLCYKFFESHVFGVPNKYYTQYRYTYVYVYICLFSQRMLQILNRISYILYISTLNSEQRVGILILDPRHIFDVVPICLSRIMSTTSLNQFPRNTMSMHIYITFYLTCRLFSIDRQMILFPLLYFCQF